VSVCRLHGRYDAIGTVAAVARNGLGSAAFMYGGYCMNVCVCAGSKGRQDACHRGCCHAQWSRLGRLAHKALRQRVHAKVGVGSGCVCVCVCLTACVCVRSMLSFIHHFKYTYIHKCTHAWPQYIC
jgi:hypothetical protein